MLDIITMDSIFHSISENTYCDTCNIAIKEEKLYPNIGINNFDGGIQNVQKWLQPYTDQARTICPKCGNNGKVRRIPSLFFFVESENYSCPEKQCQITSKIADIPKKHWIRRQTFLFESSYKSNRQWGTWILAHIKRNSNVWETYDDVQLNVAKTPNKMLVFYLVFLMQEDEEVEKFEISQR